MFVLYLLHLKVIANYMVWDMVMGGYYHYFFMNLTVDVYYISSFM